MKNTMLGVMVFTLCFTIEVTKGDYTFGEPNNLGPIVNTRYNQAATCTSADNLELYFGSDMLGGLGEWDIWISKREDVNAPWGAPENLGAPVNSQYSERYPSLSSDGLTLYFSDGITSWRPNQRQAEIWMTTRASRNDPWTKPVNVSSINSDLIDISPTISGDNLILIFTSGRGGSLDLWMSTRTTVHDNWNSPVKLGGNINSSSHDLECSLSRDGLALVFCSNRPGGFGDYDLWMTTRMSRDDPWNPAINLGRSINSNAGEGSPGLSYDKKILYFDSNRQGGFGFYDIYEAPIIPIVDFNGDGVVDAVDMCIIVDYWSTDEALCDIGPTPWGDGAVDVEDIKVLAQHLFEEVKDPTLIAHWPFDETEGDVAYDSVAEIDGTLIGDPVWQPNGGVVGGALHLDGIDDYVRTDTVLNSADGVLSVLTWVKGGALGQVAISQSNGANWLLANPSEGKLMTSLSHPPSGRTPPPPLVSEFVITDGDWHRIGFVWDGAYRILYVDGAEVAKDTVPLSGLEISNGGLYFGTGSAMQYGTFWSGLIDDIRIYDRAVSP
jgi:hypothetical protein